MTVEDGFLPETKVSFTGFLCLNLPTGTLGLSWSLAERNTRSPNRNRLAACCQCGHWAFAQTWPSSQGSARFRRPGPSPGPTSHGAGVGCVGRDACARAQNMACSCLRATSGTRCHVARTLTQHSRSAEAPASVQVCSHCGRDPSVWVEVQLQVDTGESLRQRPCSRSGPDSETERQAVLVAASCSAGDQTVLDTNGGQGSSQRPPPASSGLRP